MSRVVEGARDLLPKDMLLQKWISGQIEKVLELYGFEPWDSPLLEYRALYTEHSNEDLVNQQAFTFNDVEGNEVVLRSELTPSLARVVAMHQPELSFPLRWYSHGPFWRNENLIPGRGREFRQWNIDTVGIPEPAADVELILLSIHLLEKFGFSSKDVVLKVNNRSLLKRKLLSFGIAEEDFSRMVRLLDRAAKSKWVHLRREAEGFGCSRKQLHMLEEYLQDDSAWKEDELLCTVFNAAERLGKLEFLKYDPGIVRFPLYYTGLVFEAFDRQGKYPAILGGGRYDRLVQNVGGEPLPAAGFAIGDITLARLLSEMNYQPPIKKSAPELIVGAQKADFFQYAVEFAQRLRSLGHYVEIAPFFGDHNLHLDYTKRKQGKILVFMATQPDQLPPNIEWMDITKQSVQSFYSVPEAVSHFVDSRPVLSQAVPSGIQELEKEVSWIN